MCIRDRSMCIWLIMRAKYTYQCICARMYTHGYSEVYVYMYRQTSCPWMRSTGTWQSKDCAPCWLLQALQPLYEILVRAFLLHLLCIDVQLSLSLHRFHFTTTICHHHFPHNFRHHYDYNRFLLCHQQSLHPTEQFFSTACILYIKQDILRRHCG